MVEEHFEQVSTKQFGDDFPANDSESAPIKKKRKTHKALERPVAIQIVPTRSEIRKARRTAKRRRALVACVPCKLSRTKCNDSRPCSRCQRIGRAESCEPTNPVQLWHCFLHFCFTELKCSELYRMICIQY